MRVLLFREGSEVTHKSLRRELPPGRESLAGSGQPVFTETCQFFLLQ